MAIVDRTKLKKAFEEGSIPSQQDFENLVDSMIHKNDSGSISQEEGLKLSPKGPNKKMVTFFDNLADFNPKWSIEAYPKNDPDFGLNLVDSTGKSSLFINYNGKIGVGTTNPSTQLDVKGNVSFSGRKGTFAAGEIPGDGLWHNITPKLDGCHAFEVVAKIGKPGKGLYSMVHAIALSTFGRSRNKITKTEAFYGSFMNKIDLQWAGHTFNFYLQMRTRRDYGKDTNIKYHITNLWWED